MSELEKYYLDRWYGRLKREEDEDLKKIKKLKKQRSKRK